MAGNTTTDTSGIGSLMQTFYDRMLLERLEPELRYDQFGEKKELPANSGKTVIWNRLKNFASGYALTELTVPGLSAFSATKVSATVVEFGQLIGISEFFDMTAINQPVKDAIELLVDSAARTVDQYISDEIGFGSVCSTGMVTGSASSVTFLSCYTQGFPLLVNRTLSWTKVGLANANNPAASAINVDRVRLASTQLRKMNARPQSDGYYQGIIHPEMADLLMQDANWASWNQYTNPEAMYKAEIGRVAGVRFSTSTNAMTTTMLASAWSAGASNFSAGGTVYGTLIVGKGAYGVTKLYAGNGVKTAVVDMKPDKADPLGQYGTAGYQIKIAAKILNPSAGVILVDYVSA